MTKIRTAVIGYGHLGKWHAQKAERFPEVAELKYIVEKGAVNQLAAKNAHPNARIVGDIEECINDIDAAFVVTPTSLHFELVKKLIANNIHVFCEKPVTETSEEAKAVKELIGDKKLIVQIGHSERFHQAWEKLSDIKSFFAPPASIHLKRVAPFKGRATDVDVAHDLMIHDLDLLVYLFGEVPVSVEAQGFKMRTSHNDYVNAHFKFTSGSRATISVGRNQTKEVRELEVINSQGSVLVDLMKNEIQIAKANSSGPEFVEVITYEKRDHLLIEHGFFYQSIRDKTKPVVSIDDGILAVKLIEKVLKSIENKCEEKI